MTGRTARIATQLQGHRQKIALLLYSAVVACAYSAAYLFRFEFAVPADYAVLFAWTLAPLILIRLAAFRAFRLTRERWRYASTPDAARLVAASALGTIVFVILFDVLLPQVAHVPLSILAAEAVLTSSAIAGMWLTYRLAFEHMRRSGNGRRVLIVGAGEAGNMLAREMMRGETGYVPIGFIDDDPVMWGASVRGLEVIGATVDLATIAAHERADEIVIATPSATPDELRRVVQRCEETSLPFKVLPGIREVLAGDIRLNQLRNVRIEDLLGREPVRLDLPELAEDLADRDVLITGAAGSIGSELARQVALHRPRTLVLLDQAETDLFYIDLELREKHPDLRIVPLIADVVDASAIEAAFRRFRPQRVFHAAAYKHVPMMELNAREAIRNNVIGTWRIAEAAGRYGAEKFVLVSTDKAVRPTNVMGATKRLAELVVLELQTRFSGTTYGAVRFGNVLGSNGSVIPIFKRQLSEGKPLTVTHPDVTRYFMTIPEAVQLILQASMLCEFRGHIAMLEMGEPVRIADLAMNLLRLTGASASTGGVIYTGLRPGEKLHEELIAPDERAFPTAVPKVRVLQTPALPSFAVASQVEAWDAALRDERDSLLLSGFFDLFPGLDRVNVVEQAPATPLRSLRIGA